MEVSQLEKTDRLSRIQALEDEEHEEIRKRHKTVELGGPHSPGRHDGGIFNAEVRFLLKCSLGVTDKGLPVICIPQWVRMTLHGSSELTPEFTNDLTLEDAVKRLTPRFKGILIQRYAYGLSWKEVSQEMHYQESWLREQETRALRELRRIICSG